jgi:hypothetical protein
LSDHHAADAVNVLLQRRGRAAGDGADEQVCGLWGGVDIDPSG